ncbi:MAG: hypothetical protein IKK91_01640 [Ruminococcus sp.]|nr:hypothetical protein [Ruminococcus sp.]
MSKLIKSNNYKKVNFGSENAVDLSNFTELNAGSGRKGDIGITETCGSYRVVLYSTILSLLESAENVKVYLGERMIAVKPVSPDTPGAYEIKKGGIIYSSDLAEKIIALATSVEFKPNATTRCGRIEQVQTNEDDTSTVIISFE